MSPRFQLSGAMFSLNILADVSVDNLESDVLIQSEGRQLEVMTSVCVE